MLQAFLLQFIPAMVQGVTLAIPLGILLAVFLRLDLPEYKNTLKRALYWGFWLSLFFVAVKVGTRNAITREGFEATYYCNSHCCRSRFTCHAVSLNATYRKRSIKS